MTFLTFFLFLAAITSLKKLVNHPDLVYPACRERKEGFDSALELFPPGHDPESGRLRPDLSGKLSVLDCLLAVVKSSTTDKVINLTGNDFIIFLGSGFWDLVRY